jgi:hypothetical protein
MNINDFAAASSSVSMSKITGNNLTIGSSAINDFGDGATITSNSGNSLIISKQSYYNNYQTADSTNPQYGDPWQQSPWTIPPTVYPGGGTIGPYNAPAPNPIIIPAPKDELQSPPKDEKAKEGHVLTATMKIYGDAVVVEYYCSHCDQIIHREVISKVPRRIIEEKCLPRIIKEVK